MSRSIVVWFCFVAWASAQDYTVRSEPTMDFGAHNGRVVGVHLDSLGMLTSVAGDGTIRTWDSDGKSQSFRRVPIDPRYHHITAARFYGDGLFVAGNRGASVEFHVARISLTDQTEVWSEVYQEPTAQIDFGKYRIHPHGNVIRVWDGKHAKFLHRHADSVTGVAQCPAADKPYLASCSIDKTIRLWPLGDDPGKPDLEVGSCTHRIYFGSAIDHVAWSPDGAVLAAVDSSGTVRLFDVEWDGGRIESIQSLDEARTIHCSNAEASPDERYRICISPDGERIAVLGSDVWVFDLAREGDEEVDAHDVTWGWATCCDWNKDSDQLVVGDSYGSIIAFDVDEEEIVRAIRPRSLPISELSWDQNSSSLRWQFHRHKDGQPAGDWIKQLPSGIDLKTMKPIGEPPNTSSRQLQPVIDIRKFGVQILGTRGETKVAFVDEHGKQSSIDFQRPWSSIDLVDAQTLIVSIPIDSKVQVWKMTPAGPTRAEAFAFGERTRTVASLGDTGLVATYSEDRGIRVWSLREIAHHNYDNPPLPKVTLIPCANGITAATGDGAPLSMPTGTRFGHWIGAPPGKTALSDFHPSDAAILDDFQASQLFAHSLGEVGWQSYVNEAILHDLTKLSVEERRYARYVIWTPSWLSGRHTTKRLAEQRQQFALLLNSVSWSSHVTLPAIVDGPGTILRFHLNDFKRTTGDWDLATWELLLSGDPYRLDWNQDENFARISVMIGQFPFVRGDWLLHAAAFTPLYRKWLDLPATEVGLERALRVLKTPSDQLIVPHSSPMIHNRLVKRSYIASLEHRAFWKTFEFDRGVGNKNLFAYRGRIPDDVHRERHSSEVLFHLPNGLSAFAAYNQHGIAWDELPDEVLRSPAKFPESCFRCHAGLGGFALPAGDLIDSHANLPDGTGIQDASENRQQELQTFQARVKSDRERYGSAIAQTNLPRSECANNYLIRRSFSNKGYMYGDQLLGLDDVAAELGIPVERIRLRMTEDASIHKLLCQAEMQLPALRREDFEIIYSDLVEAFELGRTPKVPVTSVTPAATVAEREKYSPVTPAPSTIRYDTWWRSIQLIVLLTFIVVSFGIWRRWL